MTDGTARGSAASSFEARDSPFVAPLVPREPVARKNGAMTRIATTLALAAGLAAIVGAAAPARAAGDTAPAIAPTRILVLGSAHLAELARPLDAQALAPLVDRLVAFHPDIIAVEAMPGEACDLAARHPARYDPQDVGRYCATTAAAGAATGLDVPAALARLHDLLAGWPAAPTPSQRRGLAAVALAAGEPDTARLQWQALPPDERHAGDGLPAALAASLDRPPSGEIEQLAVPVAARLGLARLHAVDDHSGDNVDVADGAAYGRAIQAAWATSAGSLRPLREREAALVAAGDALGLYRRLNDSDVLRTMAEGDFGAAAREPSPQHYGRIYVAGWEARNLRIAGNVAAAMREHPGARVLVIIGAMHKPWIERLLGGMKDVQIEDARRVLR